MQLPTEKAEMRALESEPGATSDRESRNAGFRVRTRCNFGQRKRKCELLSPNLEQLRTEKAEIRCFESEPEATSDGESRNAGFRVRTRITWIPFEKKAINQRGESQSGELARTRKQAYTLKTNEA